MTWPPGCLNALWGILCFSRWCPMPSSRANAGIPSLNALSGILCFSRQTVILASGAAAWSRPLKKCLNALSGILRFSRAEYVAYRMSKL